MKEEERETRVTEYDLNWLTDAKQEVPGEKKPTQWFSHLTEPEPIFTNTYTNLAELQNPLLRSTRFTDMLR